MVMCHCCINSAVKWVPGSNKNVTKDSVLVDQTLYMPSVEVLPEAFRRAKANPQSKCFLFLSK